MHGLTRRPETQSAYSYYAGAEGAWPYAWARTCDLSLVVSVVFLSSSETAMGLTPPKSAVPFQILRDSQAKQREGVLLHATRVQMCTETTGWMDHQHFDEAADGHILALFYSLICALY